MRAWVCCTLATLPLFLSAAVPAKRPAKPAKATPRKSPAAVKAKAPAAKPVPTPEAVAAKWMASLTPRERAAQLIVAPFNGFPSKTRAKEYRTLVRLVQKERIGGLILINVVNGHVSMKPGPREVATFINRMQGMAKVPLIVGGDLERGASMRVDSTTVFPHAMTLTASRDPEMARIEGRITAKEARALGMQWIFFPDADVNNNPDNPIINIRSFGENPADVSAMVSAFIEGAHAAAPVLVTAKHFPGHGDTAIDTHMNMATLEGNRERLEAMEWAPFRAAIRSGVDSVMSAHIAVPSIDPSGSPATLSLKLLSGVLRGEMGFGGLVVTDALEMRGIQNGFTVGEAAVRAVEAGVDVLLMPPDATAALDALVAAVKSGRLAQSRIDESAKRILQAKARVGLGTAKLVDLKAIPAAVNTKTNIDAAQHISDLGVTLVRNTGGTVPLANPEKTAFFVLAESARSNEGQTMAAEFKLRARGAPVELLHQDMSMGDLMAAFDRASGASQFVVAAFASVSAYRGNVALAGSYPELVQKMIATGKPVVLVAMGNPYLLRSFPQASAYMTTYSTVPPTEVSAVRAIFGEIPVTGKLPVSIPGLAAYMDGISLPGPAARAAQ
ncbi:MAG TPA: glycoside hydrolase family 3 N-terminal domain-containing protein [Bryobacteraceae bacterium]|nr:glycoside hydrolase family 3 N-terminal domain-containing protein [Bryobacteraceae bacterium]